MMEEKLLLYVFTCLTLLPYYISTIPLEAAFQGRVFMDQLLPQTLCLLAGTGTSMPPLAMINNNNYLCQYCPMTRKTCNPLLVVCNKLLYNISIYNCIFDEFELKSVMLAHVSRCQHTSAQPRAV